MLKKKGVEDVRVRLRKEVWEYGMELNKGIATEKYRKKRGLSRGISISASKCESSGAFL